MKPICVIRLHVYNDGFVCPIAICFPRIMSGELAVVRINLMYPHFLMCLARRKHPLHAIEKKSYTFIIDFQHTFGMQRFNHIEKGDEE